MIFENLSNKLYKIFYKIKEKGRLTSENINDTLRQVRIALLEADVALVVVQKFIQEIKKISLDKKINNYLTPGQEFIKIVQKELIKIIGSKNNNLNFCSGRSVIFLIGLQGSGKTTTTGKLAKYLKEKNKKKVLTVSSDVYRPAAQKQLELVSKSANVDCFLSENLYKTPYEIVKSAMNKSSLYDVLLIDTAGFSHTNKKMIKEIQLLQSISSPSETLFIVDSMMGQDSINSIKTFNEKFSLTGVILTKLDGDSRGGIALSIKYITGKPIKFIGTGEKIDTLEIFSPEKLSKKILGMENIFSIINDVEIKINKYKKEKIKYKKNKKFDLTDFLLHLNQVKKIGGINKIVNQFSIMSNISPKINNKICVKMEAIINSMTVKERINPNIIKRSRKKRIAHGSGTTVQDVNNLLKQFNEMDRLFKQIKNNGLINTMKKIKNLIPFKFKKN
ncbi:ffh [Wigglesworthia glossinidia endosymbiont of Glossina brevipalpis]|uniref:signal-recognition-particle GTPase n=1 Tax=Wigglesworthia glossinidia brevipalpis TaxID=36870 RepID=Q8D2V4_WIGBR|nr:ffh [Wigglesworthia glossinidia endosymbiont of Glossina brevipalpis]